MAATHVAHLVLGLPLGGTERLVERMVRKPPPLLRASCLCLDQVGGLGEALRRDGFPVTLLGRKPGFDWRLPARIAAQTRRDAVDILHCHQYSPWFYGVLARLFHPRLKILFTEHGRFHPDLPSPKRRIFNRVMAPFTHVITAVSPAVKQALVRVEAFPENIRVVFNGIETPAAADDKEKLRTRSGLRPDWIYFILCARFDSIKGISVLLDAFKTVTEQHAPSGLLLIGDGPENEKIRARVRALGLEQHVVLPGFQDQVGAWLKAADVFVLSSFSEGTSVSLIESMAMGLPSVATSVGGTPFVVENGITGVLVPANNSEALGRAMLDLIRKPETRRNMRIAARARFEAHFQIEKMFREYQNIYLELLGSQTPSP